MNPTRKLHQKHLSKGVKTLIVALFVLFLRSPQTALAHCDSYDGPVIKEAQEALASNNVNLVLKWVSETNESEVSVLFKKAYELKKKDMAVYALVETHFFETLVRLHRATEGVGYTGLKPAGSASPIVKMADASIENQDVDKLLLELTAHIEKVVREKYQQVEALGVVKNESLEKGRAYVAAYVVYTHMLEEIHGVIEHGPEAHLH